MELRLKVHVGQDKRIAIELPPDWPGGDHLITVKSVPSTDAENRNQELFAWLDQHHANPNRRTRTREEIDAYLQAERDSWD